MLYEPPDNLAYRFPVSVKVVVMRDAQVALRYNERNERWSATKSREDWEG